MAEEDNGAIYRPVGAATAASLLQRGEVKRMRRIREWGKKILPLVRGKQRRRRSRVLPCRRGHWSPVVMVVATWQRRRREADVERMDLKGEGVGAVDVVDAVHAYDGGKSTNHEALPTGKAWIVVYREVRGVS